jgi:hypothetical protein
MQRYIGLLIESWIVILNESYFFFYNVPVEGGGALRRFPELLGLVRVHHSRDFSSG